MFSADDAGRHRGVAGEHDGQPLVINSLNP
jgi:hypothetical protein